MYFEKNKPHNRALTLKTGAARYTDDFKWQFLLENKTEAATNFFTEACKTNSLDKGLREYRQLDKNAKMSSALHTK